MNIYILEKVKFMIKSVDIILGKCLKCSYFSRNLDDVSILKILQVYVVGDFFVCEKRFYLNQSFVILNIYNIFYKNIFKYFF